MELLGVDHANGESKTIRVALSPNHRKGCKGDSFRYSGRGYNRVRVCACGAEDHDPETGSFGAAVREALGKDPASMHFTGDKKSQL